MNLFIPIILIGISVGAFFTFVAPEYEEVKALGKIDKEFQSKIRQGEEIRKKKREITEEYERNISTDDLERLEKMVPNHMDNVELIVDIDRIAKEDGVRIGEISLVQNSNKKETGGTSIEILENRNYESVNLAFSFVTKYENFKSFIDNLRRSLRLLDIVSINFTENNDTTTDGLTENFRFDIVVKSY